MKAIQVTTTAGQQRGLRAALAIGLLAALLGLGAHQLGFPARAPSLLDEVPAPAIPAAPGDNDCPSCRKQAAIQPIPVAPGSGECPDCRRRPA